MNTDDTAHMPSGVWNSCFIAASELFPVMLAGNVYNYYIGFN